MDKKEDWKIRLESQVKAIENQTRCPNGEDRKITREMVKEIIKVREDFDEGIRYLAER